MSEGLTLSQLAEKNALLVTENAALQQKLDAVLAENQMARQRHHFIRALGISIIEHSGGRMDWRGAIQDATELVQTINAVYAETPATDAILNAVRAEGAQYCIDAIVTSDSDDFIDAPNICAEVIRKLRAGNTEGATHD